MENKRIVFLIMAVIVSIIAMIEYGKFNSRKYEAKLDYYTEDINELVNDSQIVVTGIVLGTSIDKINGVNFQISNVRVDNLIKGALKDNKSIEIVQTCNLVQEPLLKKQKEYLLFLEKYNGSLHEDAYVAKGLYHGIYMLDDSNFKALTKLNPVLTNKIESFSLQELSEYINIKIDK